MLKKIICLFLIRLMLCNMFLASSYAIAPATVLLDLSNGKFQWYIHEKILTKLDFRTARKYAINLLYKNKKYEQKRGIGLLSRGSNVFNLLNFCIWLEDIKEYGNLTRRQIKEIVSLVKKYPCIIGWIAEKGIKTFLRSLSSEKLLDEDVLKILSDDFLVSQDAKDQAILNKQEVCEKIENIMKQFFTKKDNFDKNEIYCEKKLKRVLNEFSKYEFIRFTSAGWRCAILLKSLWNMQKRGVGWKYRRWLYDRMENDSWFFEKMIRNFNVGLYPIFRDGFSNGCLDEFDEYFELYSFFAELLIKDSKFELLSKCIDKGLMFEESDIVHFKRYPINEKVKKEFSIIEQHGSNIKKDFNGMLKEIVKLDSVGYFSNCLFDGGASMFVSPELLLSKCIKQQGYDKLIKRLLERKRFIFHPSYWKLSDKKLWYYFLINNHGMDLLKEFLDLPLSASVLSERAIRKLYVRLKNDKDGFWSIIMDFLKKGLDTSQVLMALIREKDFAFIDRYFVDYQRVWFLNQRIVLSEEQYFELSDCLGKSNSRLDNCLIKIDENSSVIELEELDDKFPKIPSDFIIEEFPKIPSDFIADFSIEKYNMLEELLKKDEKTGEYIYSYRNYRSYIDKLSQCEEDDVCKQELGDLQRFFALLRKYV